MSCARRSVCFCNRGGGRARLLAQLIVTHGELEYELDAARLTPGMLDGQCRLPYVTTASGWAEVDTWSLIHGGCYHVNEVRGPYGL